MIRPAFVWSPHYEVDIGKHVFPTQKFRLLKEAAVERLGVREEEIIESPRATREELLSVLTPEYVTDLENYKHTERTRRSELPITRSIIEGMIYTAGGTITGSRQALARKAACHFGGGYHHGFADHAEGFCYINDIAVALRVLKGSGEINKSAVIDVDVHQGNGTANIFKDDSSTLTISIHEEDQYPRTKEKSDLDIGLPANPGFHTYRRALEEAIEAAVNHQPDLVIYAAGADTFQDDQLGRLGLTKEEMQLRDELVLQTMLQHQIPFLTVVSGGYAKNLEDTIDLHLQTVDACLRLTRHANAADYALD